MRRRDKGRNGTQDAVEGAIRNLGGAYEISQTVLTRDIWSGPPTISPPCSLEQFVKVG